MYYFAISYYRTYQAVCLVRRIIKFALVACRGPFANTVLSRSALFTSCSKVTVSSAMITSILRTYDILLGNNLRGIDRRFVSEARDGFSLLLRKRRFSPSDPLLCGIECESLICSISLQPRSSP